MTYCSTYIVLNIHWRSITFFSDTHHHPKDLQNCFFQNKISQYLLINHFRKFNNKIHYRIRDFDSLANWIASGAVSIFFYPADMSNIREENRTFAYLSFSLYDVIMFLGLILVPCGVGRRPYYQKHLDNLNLTVADIAPQFLITR